MQAIAEDTSSDDDDDSDSDEVVPVKVNGLVCSINRIAFHVKQD